MRDKFRNKNGTLTRYAFACGYVEEYPATDGATVRVFHDGGACFHARRSDWKSPGEGEPNLWWFSSESLTAVRRAARALRKGPLPADWPGIYNPRA